MKKTLLLFVVLILNIIYPALSQELTPVPFNSENWDFRNTNYTIHQFMGKESIELSQGGIAVKDVEFLNGTIQVDINFTANFSFPGVFFRGQGPENLESFYIRPHQSGNPDAVQYTPVFNGLSGWQLYFGEGFWQAVELMPNTWHTIRINVLDDQADVYFNNMEEPILKITDLKRDITPGEIGFNSGPPVHFANFKYSTENPVLIDREGSETNEKEHGLITSWQLSNLLEDSDYSKKPTLDSRAFNWDTYPTEETGTINIAKFRSATETENTVLAKLIINAKEASIKELQFGYTDYIWAYFNGKLVYSGRNDYRSRDYRYLGSIGFFDTFYLPLEKGDNEVVFVVRELFGGWGLKAKIEDLEGLTIK